MSGLDSDFDAGSISAIFRRVATYYFYAADLKEALGTATYAMLNLHYAYSAREVALREARADWTRAAEIELRFLENQVTVAASLESDGHSLLHGNSLIGLWGATEAAVEDIASLWYRARPRPGEISEIQRVKVPLGEMLDLDRDGQARRVVRELQQATGADSRRGVGQFESVLGPLGLGGPVPEQVARSVLHAQQARHVIAHRGGIADSRFIAACPWLGLSVGDPVVITASVFRNLEAALSHYVSMLAIRVEEAASTSGAWDEIFASFRAQRRERGAGAVSSATQHVEPAGVGDPP